MARLVDREGNIWFGDTKGIHRFFYGPLIRQEFPREDLGNVDFALAVDDNGAVWISSGNSGGPPKAGLFYVSGGKAQHRLPQVTTSFAYRALDKTFWFSGEGCLWHHVGKKFLRVNLPRDVAKQFAFLQAIVRDKRAGIWVSLGGYGLYWLADGIWTPYGGRNDFPKTGVMTEFADSLGRVWLGYPKSQLAVLVGDRLRVFGPSNGLQLGNITTIYGRGPEIWLGVNLGWSSSTRDTFTTSPQ
jgi:hypothetical protein